jgi:hypothetical protein
MKWWSEMDGARTEPDRMLGLIGALWLGRTAQVCCSVLLRRTADLYCGLVIADRRRHRGLLLSRATRDED